MTRMPPRQLELFGYKSLLLEELLIGDIPVGIVEPHHHVIPFWFEYIQDPADLLHIDAHPDMATLEIGVPGLPITAIDPTDKLGKFFMNLLKFMKVILFVLLIMLIY